MADDIRFDLAELATADALDRVGGAIKDELSNASEREWTALKWSLMRDKVAGAVAAKLAGLDPFVLLAQGWCKAVELREHGVATRDAPGSEARMTLGKHGVRKALHPIVTMMLGPLESPPIRFTLDLDGAFESVLLVIRGGRLMACRPGQATFAAGLSYGEISLCRRDHAFPVGGEHPFGDNGLAIPDV